MLRKVFVSILLFAGLALRGMAPEKSPQEAYIARYAAIAVSEMYRSGVPASITLAQGLLESNAGRSTLATQGNNHFGIKCHDWKGKSMRVDDDAPKECFRVYDDADASFVDHSDFLRYWDRYKFLFEFKTTDYKSWANGLKKAGYATDPGYPAKLIKLIEDYHLYDYDKMTVAQAGDIEGSEVKEAKAVKTKVTRKERRRARRNKKADDQTEYIDVTLNTIPESPLAIEEPKKVEKSGETFTFSLNRTLLSRNGVPYITAVEGETVSSIAASNKLFEKEVLRFNDMSSGAELLPGQIVYLQPKKSQSVRGLEKYIVGEDGESLWEISQRFGVKLSSIYKMNDLSSGSYLREGDTIILREGSLVRKVLGKK